MVIRHFVEYYKPGEHKESVEVEEIDHRDPKKIVRELDDDDVYAFQFYNKITGQGRDVKGRPERFYGKRSNNSQRYYIDATVFNLNSVKLNFPEEKTLIENMERSKFSKVVKTRAGNFQPFSEKHHEIIKTSTAMK